ncbi:MAG: porin family protein [Epsilonproteobacteria bacterium]|nr:porin family protein [Campylobacterota bacterium]
MKRIGLAVLLASGLMAAGNENYFGVSVGEADISLTASALGASATVDDTEKAYNITLGHYYGNRARVSATYTRVDYDIDPIDALSFAYDFILPVADDKLGFYAGPVAGYTWYKDSLLDLSGFHYGAHAGAIVKIADNFEIEAGYAYIFETGNDTVVGEKIEIDNAKKWYVGANIRF